MQVFYFPRQLDSTRWLGCLSRLFIASWEIREMLCFRRRREEVGWKYYFQHCSQVFCWACCNLLPKFYCILCSVCWECLTPRVLGKLMSYMWDRARKEMTLGIQVSILPLALWDRERRGLGSQFYLSTALSLSFTSWARGGSASICSAHRGHPATLVHARLLKAEGINPQACDTSEMCGGWGLSLPVHRRPVIFPGGGHSFRGYLK